MGTGTASLLFLGNSYTSSHDLEGQVTERLGLADAALVVASEAVHPGGASWVDHLDAMQTPESPQSQAIAKRDWDWWVLQEQSQIPGFPTGQVERDASGEALLALVEDADAQGGSPVLFLTWGRRDGDPHNPTLFEDYPQMQDRLTEGYLDYVSTLDGAGVRAAVAPVGEAFRKVYEDTLAQGGDPLRKGSSFERLYAEDGSHPSFYGTYLASAVIQGAITGRPSSLYLKVEGLDDPDFASYLDEVAQEVVHEAPLGSFPYPWAMTFDAWDSQDISHPFLWPWVEMDQAWEGDLLLIGSSSQKDCRSAGRLVLVEGAQWVGERVEAGPSGDGELHLAGGELVVHTLRLAEQPHGVGALYLEGGRLVAQRVELGEGEGKIYWTAGTLEVAEWVGLPLEQSGGTMVLTDRVDLDGDYGQGPDGVLLIEPGASLHPTGTALLEGQLHVLDILGDSSDVVVSPNVSAAAAQWVLGEGLVWELVSSDGFDVLRVRRVSTDKGVEVAPLGCGCSGLAPALSTWAFLWGALCVRRRG
jgi:hypothetical protein